MTSFSSLFLVNFHFSILDESHYLLIKRSCKTDDENLDSLRARFAGCCLQPIFQLSKKSLWPSLWLRFLYLRASGENQHTFSRSRGATLL